jgi:hypothetical protein
MRAEFAIELLQLGQQFARLGLSKPALDLSRRGSALTAKLVAAFADNLDHHFNHHFALGQLARLLTMDEQLEDARTTYLELIAALSQLEQQLPNTPDLALERGKLQFESAKTYRALAGISIKQIDLEKAIDELNKAESGLRLLISQFPNDAAIFQEELALTLKIKASLDSQPATAQKPAH